jgi:hypothetical protein
MTRATFIVSSKIHINPALINFNHFPSKVPKLYALANYVSLDSSDLLLSRMVFSTKQQCDAINIVTSRHNKNVRDNKWGEARHPKGRGFSLAKE